MRVVFDTNALLSATLWSGSSAQKLLFRLIRRGDTVFSSKEILEEYQRVLRRDFEYSEKEMGHIISRLLAFIVVVNPLIRVKIVETDPKDDMIIECALAARAEFIVTYDRHLLSIRRHKYIEILKPEELIEKGLNDLNLPVNHALCHIIGDCDAHSVHAWLGIKWNLHEELLVHRPVIDVEPGACFPCPKLWY